MAKQAVERYFPATGDFAEIQGIVYNGWKEHKYAAFLFARFGDDAARSRAWLAEVNQKKLVTPLAKELQPTATRVQLALTASGLTALGVPARVLDTFPQELKLRMAGRRVVLRDQPDNWTLGAPDDRIDVLLMLYADEPTTLSTLLRDQREALAAHGATLRPDEVSTMLSEREHFGFADGISQPFLRREGRDNPKPGQDVVATGEILLGYRNAYNEMPQSPMWDHFDLGANGTYLVFRKLDQHVATLWGWLAEQARQLAKGDATEAARLTEFLGAKMMGRWRSGASLVQTPLHDNDKYADEDHVNLFKYVEKDAFGEACPIGSHVRRANPRDGRGDDPADSEKVVRRHRLLRRGRSYGTPLRFEDAVTGKDDGVSRGLYFISLQASIARGFEFVQQTWLSNPGFNSMFDETDPITGGRATHFTIPCAPLPMRLYGVPRVVSVVGGEYFFLPSVPALTRLAAG
jgi:Dyp-type peroxidase family